LSIVLGADSNFSLVEPWNIVDLINRELPKVPCWIEPAVLPKGAKMLFGGHAKIGKSFIMLELARSLALGKAPFGAPGLAVPTPTKILMLEQEIGPWGIQKRATTLLAGEDKDRLQTNFHGLSQIRGLRLDTPGVTHRIAEWVHKVEASVLFLDPIGKMHSYDENDATQINRLFHKLDEIMELCRDLSLSIVLSHHFSKPNRDPRIILDDDQLFSPYNFRGTTRWYDDPDTLVTCNRLPNDVPRAHKWWYVKTRWETRQGGDVPEWMTFSVNRQNDLRVRYEENAGLLVPVQTAPSGPAKARLATPFRVS
jgi:AAA domain